MHAAGWNTPYGNLMAINVVINFKFIRNINIIISLLINGIRFSISFNFIGDLYEG
jgi:hypothetical protein